MKIRLGRQDQTRIFSYADQFEPAVKEYSNGQRSRPDPVTHLLVGQKGDNLDEVLIQVSIVSRKALDDLDAADRQVYRQIIIYLLFLYNLGCCHKCYKLITV